MLQHFECKAQNFDQQASLLKMWAENLRKFTSACYKKFFADIVNGIFESFGGQLLFRSEFVLHCWIAEGFQTGYFKLENCKYQVQIEGICIAFSFISSRSHNAMWAEFLKWISRWVTIWFPLPHEKILILFLKGRQQLLFRSEFFLRCWIAEGFVLYFLSFLQDRDQNKKHFLIISNTMQCEQNWFTIWFPFPHDSILILSLKGRQQLAWLMSSKECLATLPNQGRLCKKKMHFCIVEAWVWHRIKA